MSIEEFVGPLECWVENHAQTLNDDIKTYLSMYNLSDYDQKQLLRMIMISVRYRSIVVPDKITYSDEYDLCSIELGIYKNGGGQAAPLSEYEKEIRKHYSDCYVVWGAPHNYHITKC